MRTEIRDRINTIIENDAGLGGAFTTFKTYPPSLEDSKLPAVIVLPRQGQQFSPSGSGAFSSSLQFDIRVYLAPAGTRLSSINNIEALEFPDLFEEAFLSRLQLQYGDLALNVTTGSVSGNLQFQIASDLGRLIEYPVGLSGAPLFWGFIARISIPYRKVITSKVRGT